MRRIAVLASIICGLAFTPCDAQQLPREPFGLRLAEPVSPQQASRWEVTLGAFNMVEQQRVHWYSLPPGAPPVIEGLRVFKDCPERVLTACRDVDYSKVPLDRTDAPGSLHVYVAQFADAKLLGVSYELNRRIWTKTTLAEAARLFVQRYGHPVKVTPIKESVLPMPYGGRKVTESGDWLWEDDKTRVYIHGIGDKLNFVYGYMVFIGDLSLLFEAEQRRKQLATEEDERRREQLRKEEDARKRSLN